MPKAVVAIVSNPVGKDDRGIVAEGFYTLDGDLLTMTDRDGVPLRDENNGAQITHRLLPGESEKVVAKRLTLRRHREENRDEMAGFHRWVRYGHSGLA
jgi:hypothetical protein